MFEDRLAVATKIKSKCMEATWPSCSFLCMMLQIWQVFSDINGILPVSEFCVRFWFLQKDKAFMTKTDPVSSPCKNHGSNANRSPNQIRFLTWPFHNSAPPAAFKMPRIFQIKVDTWSNMQGNQLWGKLLSKPSTFNRTCVKDVWR